MWLHLLTCRFDLPYGASKPFLEPRFDDFNCVKNLYHHLTQFIFILKINRINSGYIWGIEMGIKRLVNPGNAG